MNRSRIPGSNRRVNGQVAPRFTILRATISALLAGAVLAAPSPANALSAAVKVYWVDFAGGKVYSAPGALGLDGAGIVNGRTEFASGLSSPRYIAADSATVIVGENGGNIYRFNVDGTGKTLLGNFSGISGLALDGNSLYFTSWNSGVLKTDLNGQTPQTLVSGGIAGGSTSGYNGVAVDSGHIYFINYNDGKLFSADKDGNSPISVYTKQTSGGFVEQLQALAVDSHYLYVADSNNNGQIIRIDKANSASFSRIGTAGNYAGVSIARDSVYYTQNQGQLGAMSTTGASQVTRTSQASSYGIAVVSPPPAPMQPSPLTLSIIRGDTATVSVTAATDPLGSGANVTATSETTTIATVTSSATSSNDTATFTVTAEGVGTTRVRFASTGYDTATVNVTVSALTVTTPTLDTTTAKQGETITASATSNAGSVAYRWYRDSIGPANLVGSSASYTPVSADAGNYLRVVAVATNGSAVETSTATITAVVNVGPLTFSRAVNFGNVSIGSGIAYDTVTVTNGGTSQGTSQTLTTSGSGAVFHTSVPSACTTGGALTLAGGASCALVFKWAVPATVGTSPTNSFTIGGFGNLPYSVSVSGATVGSVTYSSQNSTSGTVPTDSAQYALNAQVTVLGNPNNLARDGYAFAGWTTNSGGTGTVVSTANMGSSGLTLYPKWLERSRLMNLAVSEGTLSPAFDSATATYNVSVPTTTSTITVTPTKSQAGITTILVNGDSVTSGSVSQPISLSYGNNAITVVLSGTNMSTETYTITVNRPSPPTPSPSSSGSAPSGPTVEPVGGVKVTLGGNEAVVSWNAPNSGAAVTPSRYVVESIPDGKSCIVNAPATSCTVTGLTSGTTYRFNVTVYGGSSAASISSSEVKVADTAKPTDSGSSGSAGNGASGSNPSDGAGGTASTPNAPRTVARKAVLFDALSAALTPAGKSALERLVTTHGKAARYRAVGFVQPTAKTGNDMSLSRSRANNVAAFLRSLGVPSNKIVTKAGARSRMTGPSGRRVEVSVVR